MHARVRASGAAPFQIADTGPLRKDPSPLMRPRPLARNQPIPATLQGEWSRRGGSRQLQRTIV